MKITPEQLLERVKKTNNITGNFHDDRVKEYINDVKRFMAGVDVPAAVLETDAVVGLIAMGVDSLMETGDISPYVQKRIIQERLTEEPKEAAANGTVQTQ